MKGAKKIEPVALTLPSTPALIFDLLEKANELRRKVEANLDFDGRREWLGLPPVLPTPVALLVQCLLAGVECANETLVGVLQLAAFFAQGCRTAEDWRALSAGPHGKELVKQAWLLYESMQWPEDTWLRNTCAVLAAFRHQSAYGSDTAGIEELKRLIRSAVREEIGLGLLTCGGLLWTSHGECAEVANAMPLEDIESRLFLEDPALCEAAIWAWSSILRERRSSIRPEPRVLDRLTSIWLGETAAKRSFHVAGYGLCQHMGLPRDAWSPALTEQQAEQVRSAAYPPSDDPDVLSTSLGAALVVAFHSRRIWTDEDLSARLKRAAKERRLFIRGPAEDRKRLVRMLEQL